MAPRLELGLVRQVGDHPLVGFQASQDVRAYQGAQRSEVFGPRQSLGKVCKDLLSAQESGVGKVEDRPQVGKTVLHRRAGERDARLRVQLLHLARLLRTRILDRLGFIEDGQPPLHVDKRRRAQECTVGRHHEIDVAQTLRVQRSELVCGAFRGMCDQDTKVRRETRGFCRPVGQQRCRNDQQGRAEFLALVLALQYQEQGEHLDGLAQAHVIGKARSQPQPGEEVQPTDADLLIRAQRGLELRPGADLRKALRLTQSLQSIGQPRAGDHLRPVGIGGIVGLVERGPRQQSHRLGKWQAVFGRRPLDGLEPLQHAPELLAIHLDPASAEEMQAVAAGQEHFDLGGVETIAVERDLDGEIEQRILAQQRRHLCADACLDPRTGGTASLPCARRSAR